MSVFLTKTGGITSTSANTLANWAKNEAYAASILLGSLTYVTTHVQLINGDNPQDVRIGSADTVEVPKFIDKIARLNSFIAWMREGIKAKEELLDELKKLDVERFAKLKGLEYPDEPDYPDMVSYEDVLEEMDVRKRNSYLRLEAYAAAYGQYVHSTNTSVGAVARARNELVEKIANPSKTDGKGRDYVIYTYTPSASITDVEAMFDALQEKQRSYEQQLNVIKYSIESEVNKRNAKALADYNQAFDTYRETMKALRTALKEYCVKERERIGRLKIVVPDELKDIYEYLNSLGKEK